MKRIIEGIVYREPSFAIFFILFSFLIPCALFADRFVEIQRELHHAELQYEEAIQGHMTGDWNGWRYKIADRGVEFISSYVTDMVGNPVGGKARGFTYTGSFGLAMNVDFERALDVKGLVFFVSAVWRTGTSLTLSKIKNQFNVQQDYGSQTVKLNELFIRQSLWHDKVVFLVGRLDAGNVFFQSNLYYQYVNNAFDGNPVAVFNNFVFTAYPNATWGAYMAVAPVKKILGKFGVYNANNYINKNKYHGINFTFRSTNGVILITEWAYLLNQGEDDFGMPGNYKIGVLYQTGHKRKFLNGIAQGNLGYYILVDQTIYRPEGGKAKRALTPFAALLFAPKEKNLFPFFYTAGLVYQGPFRSRPFDSASFGIAYGKYSTDLAKLERKERREPQNFEMVLELNYWVQINKWCTFVPDVQYVIHPSGLNIPNAFCLGAQIGVVL
jgi:porin